MKSLSRQVFLKLLSQREAQGKSSSEFCFIKAQTYPVMKKTSSKGKSNPYKRIRKVAEFQAAINVVYENAVNNKMVKEKLQKKNQRKFKAKSLPWGQWKKGSKLVILHKDNSYVRLTFNLKVNPKVKYFAGKTEISESKIKVFLPSKSEFVKVRNYKISSIQKVKMAGEVYILKTK